MSLPLEITVPLPRDIPLARGVWATSPPHGRRVTVNMSAKEYDAIIAALSIIGGGISMSSYIRQLAHNTAKLLILHNTEEQRNLRSLDEQFLRDNA